MNNTEVLADFNGWSWDKTFDYDFEFIDNLIYQNLLVILGEKFLFDWRTYGSTRKSFLDEARKFIKKIVGNDKFLRELLKVLYLKSSVKDREVLDSILKEKRKELKKMDDKIKFIEESKNKKLKLTKKLGKIDVLLSDKKLLEKEFIKRNLKLEKEKQIKSIKKYEELLRREREKYVLEIADLTYVLKPSNFLNEKQRIQETIELYRFDNNLEETVISFQKEFLHFMEKKLNKMNTRDEIIDIIYELRYYKTLRISKDVKISDIEDLSNYIDKIQKKAVTLLCKLGAIKIISMDINLNYEIIKYALDTKIIDLEQIILYFEIDAEGLIIKVYDKENFEKQGRKKIKITNKTLEVRKNRKIKLFN